MISWLQRLVSAPARLVSPIVVGLVASLATVAATGATLYKWVDENGNVTYQDQPPPQGTVAEEKPLPSAVEAGESTSQTSGLDPSLPRPMIFVVPECEPCELVRAFLRERGIDFAERDASEDPTAQRQLERRAGSLKVPTLLVGSETVQGYDPDAIEAALQQAGYPVGNPDTGSETDPQSESQAAPASEPQQ